MSSPERAPRRFDAVVLAGGTARRLGGADKALVPVGESTLLERVLAATADAHRVVCVGPPRPTPVDVTWTREEPAGGGPVAGLVAGLAEVGSPVTLVLAVDLPFVSSSVARMLARDCPAGGALLVADEEGRAQPLLGAYDTSALRTRLRDLGDATNLPMGGVVDGISVRLVSVPRVARDCDTWADVESARRVAGGL